MFLFCFSDGVIAQITLAKLTKMKNQRSKPYVPLLPDLPPTVNMADTSCTTQPPFQMSQTIKSSGCHWIHHQRGTK